MPCNKAMWVVYVAMLVISACSPQGEKDLPQVLDAPRAVESDTDLLQLWRSIPQEKLEDTNVQQAVEIAERLSASGPDGLEPIFEVLASAEESPVAKIIATISLGPHVNESHIARLSELTKPEYKQTTRGCAVHLLGMISKPEADAHIRNLLEDADAYVSKEAVLALLRREETAAIQRVEAMWKNSATPPSDRNEIILAFPQSQAGENLYLYEDAVCDKSIDFVARSHALNVLGLLGKTTSLEKLDACLATEEDVHMRELITTAKTAIIAREQHAPDTAQEVAP